MYDAIDIKNKNLDLFNDIVNGYSLYSSSLGLIYFKHLDSFAYQNNIAFYLNCIKEIENEGVLSEKEQIENACQQGIWSKEIESEIISIKKSLKRLKDTKKKLVYESDKARIQEQIIEQKKALSKIENEKRNIVYLTSEQMAAKKSTDFYIKNFVFKDPDLKVKLFSSDFEFEQSDDELVDLVILYYYNFLEKTNYDKIKKLALSSDFQNLLFISDVPTEVFGKPIVYLTKNQIELLIWGKYFKNIIANTTKEIPEGLKEDPDKFLEWVDGLKEKKSQKNKKSNRNKDNSSQFLFGSSDEIKNMTGSKDISGNKILKEASEKGGLNMHELMNKTS